MKRHKEDAARAMLFCTRDLLLRQRTQLIYALPGLKQIRMFNPKFGSLDKRLRTTAEQAEATRRLQIMSGVDLVAVIAVETFTGPKETFRRGRKFAAWLAHAGGCRGCWLPSHSPTRWRAVSGRR